MFRMNRIIGYRKNGAPIYEVRGASIDTDNNRSVVLTHSQSVNRLHEITSELERIGELDNPSPEDESFFDELTAEFKKVDSHRKKLERDSQLAVVKKAGESLGNYRLESGSRNGNGTNGGRVSNSRDFDHDPFLEPDSVEANRFHNPWDLSEVRTFGRSKEELSQEFRSRAFAAIEKMHGANDNIRQAATKIIEEYDDTNSTIARMCLATSDPAYLRAFVKAARGRQHTMTVEEVQAHERAMSLTTTAGGFLIPFQLDPTVIITANGSRNQIRQIARNVVATGNRWNGVSSGAVSWSWDAEASQVSDDATTFAQPVVDIYKAAGFVPISLEALEDEANVTNEVGRLLSFGRDVLEATAFATGAGTTEPIGIITALVASSPTVIITSATADTFATADVYALDGSGNTAGTVSALPARYRSNASWLAHRAIYNRIRQFDTAGGAQMWERIGADVPAQLLGRPVYEAETMDSSLTAAAENYVLVYGDFENYVIADRIGMTVEFVPQLFGANQRPTGQRGWYAYYRVGADSVNDGAFRLLNVT